VPELVISVSSFVFSFRPSVCYIFVMHAIQLCLQSIRCSVQLAKQKSLEESAIHYVLQLFTGITTLLHKFKSLLFCSTLKMKTISAMLK